MIKTKHVELLNALSAMQESPAYAARRSVLERAEATIVVQEQEIAAQQAKIDELMLEYCQGDMTKEQLKNWGNHQRPLPASVEIGGELKQENRMVQKIRAMQRNFGEDPVGC